MSEFATLFGLGRVMPAPGTWGSLAALPLGYLAHRIGGFPLYLALTVAVFAFGWFAITRYLHGSEITDPQEIIVDETIGQLIALMPLSLGLWHAGVAPHVFPWPGWVGAFVMFRIFDILKPPPVSWAETLPGSLGVLFDDMLAGVLAAVTVALAAAVAHGWLM